MQPQEKDSYQHQEVLGRNVLKKLKTIKEHRSIFFRIAPVFDTNSWIRHVGLEWKMAEESRLDRPLPDFLAWKASCAVMFCANYAKQNVVDIRNCILPPLADRIANIAGLASVIFAPTFNASHFENESNKRFEWLKRMCPVWEPLLL